MKRIRFTLAPAFFLIWVSCLPLCAKGQAQIEAAALSTAPTGAQQISLFFNTSFTSADLATAQTASNYFVMEVNSQQVIKAAPLPAPQVIAVPGLASPIVRFELAPGSTINLDDPNASYYVFAANLTFGGQRPKNLLQAKLKKEPSAGATPQPSTIFKPGKTRQDSNIYLAGEVTGASGTDAFTSADIKIDVPLAPQLLWGRVHTFAPFFDLRASTNPKADPDSVNFGVRWSFPLLSRSVTRSAGGAAEGKFYSDLHWENAGKIEADRDFTNVNVIWTSQFMAPLNFLNTRKTKIFLDPFVGTEVGGNIDSPVAKAKGQGLARIFTGASMYVLFPFQREDLDILTLEAAYIRRWPLLEEVNITSRSDGTLLPVTINAKPKDFVEAKLNFQFNDFFGAYAGYEYGSLPPLFKLVDHRYRLGLVYKVKIQRK